MPPCVNSVIPDPPDKDAAVHGKPPVFHDIVAGHISGCNISFQNPIFIIFIIDDFSHQSFHFYHPFPKIFQKKVATPSSSLIISKDVSHNAYLSQVYKFLRKNTWMHTVEMLQYRIASEHINLCKLLIILDIMTELGLIEQTHLKNNRMKTTTAVSTRTP